MKLQVYRVKGYGSFPIDMLRYDQSFPLRESESAKILYRSDGEPIELGRHVKDDGDLPCEGRWKSFGWKIVEDSVELL